MDIRTSQLQPDTMFHIFNRGINGTQVFFEKKNYAYFLEKYTQYVHPFVKTYAYCLLGNHFHLLIRVLPPEQLDLVIKSKKGVTSTINEVTPSNLVNSQGNLVNSKGIVEQDKSYHWHVSNAFSSLFQSYTRAMNKMYQRTGSLFESPFKRIPVSKEPHLSALVSYIHQNPQKHGLIDDYRDYPYSSYHAYADQQRTSKLSKQEILDWFGGKKGFEDFHQTQHQEINEINKDWFIE